MRLDDCTLGSHDGYIYIITMYQYIYIYIYIYIYPSCFCTCAVRTLNYYVLDIQVLSIIGRLRYTSIIFY